VPAETASLAVEVVDPDAGGYVHWLLFDLPPGITGLPAGVPAEAEIDYGSKQAINTSGEVGYGGPCPPEGETHEYIFRVYALDATLDQDGGGSALNVQEALADHTLALAELVGTYGR
jgi:Raf kinase inhibitor-like YbhB/YbcL family protein